jgi:hypothetical protein
MMRNPFVIIRINPDQVFVVPEVDAEVSSLRRR